jgi:uncharacterized protein (DUF433 family)
MCQVPFISWAFSGIQHHHILIFKSRIAHEGTIKMMHLDQVVYRDPDILDATPVFRDTRMPIRSLFDYLKGGDTLEAFLRHFRCDGAGHRVTDLARETLAADAPAA